MFASLFANNARGREVVVFIFATGRRHCQSVLVLDFGAWPPLDGVGDHMGNFMTPFWHMVVAGIARVDFRIFLGYGLAFAAIWFEIGVVVFTWAQC